MFIYSQCTNEYSSCFETTERKLDEFPSFTSSSRSLKTNKTEKKRDGTDIKLLKPDTDQNHERETKPNPRTKHGFLCNDEMAC